jgi:feruloyl esterase
MNRICAGWLFSMAGVWLCAASHSATAAEAAKNPSCESLANLKLKQGAVTMAVPVPAGSFTPPHASTAPPVSPRPFKWNDTFAALPAFCRVAATLKPAANSNIQIEVWMPSSGWNGRFVGVGTEGWAGIIEYGEMALALQQGYAVASTDGGHVNPEAGSGEAGQRATFIEGHPEQLVDFAYRAVHEMTTHGKAVVAAFYGTAAKYSYWNGCATGGKSGLKEAERYPADYDGIVAGAPAYYFSHMKAFQISQYTVMQTTPDNLIPKSKYPMIHQAVLATCDALDGVKDGLIENPLACHFDPATLACKGADAPDCLTAPQVETLRRMYAPLVNPRTHQEIFPAPVLGSEINWADFSTPPTDVMLDFFRFAVFKNANWDWRTLDFDKDITLADNVDNPLDNATDTNLKPFFSRGGKLLMYHGLTDRNLSPVVSIEYFEKVRQTLGDKTADSSMRLFLEPGMSHCGGGEGPSVFDMLSPLSTWVEKGEAPTSVIASHLTAGKVDRTRPLCAYPQVAHYNGSGSTDDAASFSCAAP